MENDDHGGKQDQLEEHSLPGTNQTGKGPGSCEEDDKRIDQAVGGRSISTSSRNTAFPVPTKLGRPDDISIKTENAGDRRHCSCKGQLALASARLSGTVPACCDKPIGRIFLRADGGWCDIEQSATTLIS
jgi:hypothetical protein